MTDEETTISAPVTSNDVGDQTLTKADAADDDAGDADDADDDAEATVSDADPEATV